MRKLMKALKIENLFDLIINKVAKVKDLKT